MDSEGASGLESLPREILLQILSKLPLSSLRTLAQDPHVVDNLFENLSTEDIQCLIFRYDYPIKNQFSFVDFGAIYIEEEIKANKIQTPYRDSVHELDVVSSCNGLLCLSDSINNGLYVYNPFNQDYRQLPETIHYTERRFQVFVFGFLPTTKEYKVVNIIYYSNYEDRKGHPFGHWAMPKSDVQIFSSEDSSSSWRSLGHTSYYLDEKPAQVLVNGRIHWETFLHRYCRHRNIISFGIEDEQFRKISTPESLVLGNWDSIALRRCCLSVVLNHLGGEKLEIWAMKEYEVESSWVKEFNIESFFVPKGLKQEADQLIASFKIAKRVNFIRVLSVLRNGKILLDYKCRALVVYDPITESFDEVRFQGMPNWYETVVHVGNFNQIDSLIGM
ncbi:F-box domain containing protein [Trema orientale]|uniref:F-box domain containing protein n=1 Tax=Trema orientale TaxID=63057 RepID=A0A2P5DUZ9_TREOI|nr:F-box domain containing protein [Trema orientale]